MRWVREPECTKEMSSTADDDIFIFSLAVLILPHTRFVGLLTICDVIIAMSFVVHAFLFILCIYR